MGAPGIRLIGRWHIFSSSWVRRPTRPAEQYRTPLTLRGSAPAEFGAWRRTGASLSGALCPLPQPGALARLRADPCTRWRPTWHNAFASKIAAWPPAWRARYPAGSASLPPSSRISPSKAWSSRASPGCRRLSGMFLARSVGGRCHERRACKLRDATYRTRASPSKCLAGRGPDPHARSAEVASANQCKSQCKSENGAQKRTRTSTPLRAPAPEAGASTNSAIWARGRARHLVWVGVLVNRAWSLSLLIDTAPRFWAGMLTLLGAVWQAARFSGCSSMAEQKLPKLGEMAVFCG
jgi:hypothetical protein